MSTYTYNALKNNKIQVSGKVEALSPSDARKKIREMGLVPTHVVDVGNGKQEKKSDSKRVAKTVGALSLREKIDFTSTLEILTSTGIPIIEALLFVEQNSDSMKIRKITQDFRKQIIDGSTLGETLEKYRHIFGKVYIGLVKAGEDSGELDKTLSRMLELLKKQDNVKGKVIGALIYPSVVVILAFIAILVMLIFVFPAFDEMFNNLGKPLPPITKACMNMGVFMKQNWIIVVAALVIIPLACFKLYQRDDVRQVIDRVVLRLPMLSEMMRFSNFSNFIAVLQVSYEAGIPIIDCLALANLTMDNFVLRNAIKDVAAKVQQGTHLSVALRAVSQVPNMMTFMIATGEQSGRLGDSLFHCGSFIDKKLDATIDAFTKLIEPMLMIFIGGIVGLLGLALYLPLFQAYQT